MAGTMDSIRKFRFLIIFLSIVLFSAPNFNYSPKNSRHLKPVPDNQTFELSYSGKKLETNNTLNGYEAKSHRKSSEKIYNKERFERARYSSNYFTIDESGETLWNGKFWDANLFPLKVYVQKSYSPHFKKLYHKYIDYAFSVWEDADERIKFKYVYYPDEADIIINFDENLMEKYNQNFLGITEYEINEDNSINISFVQVSLLNFEEKKISDGEIKATIVHELGHALGLGHSSNEVDVMFPFINPHASIDMDYSDLSQGDISAIKSVLGLTEKINYSAEK
jgi:predicted Zn-dependent protease